MLPQHQAHVLILQVVLSALPFGSHLSLLRACALRMYLTFPPLEGF
jgi:hypothetical protein